MLGALDEESGATGGGGPGSGSGSDTLMDHASEILTSGNPDADPFATGDDSTGAGGVTGTGGTGTATR